MKRALELAKLGEGHTAPNPLVGAVIVKDGQIIGEGWHALYGGPHAEIMAFQSLKASAEGATLYVTLEPCSHFGKTPPCVDAIIAHKISKVIVAMLDPNPLVSGRGVQKLTEHGITVKTGILESESADLNEPFLKFIQVGCPLIVVKTAMTLDGKLASATGDSKWISNAASRQLVHKMRNKYSGIMVGIGTVLADDPSLTTRLVMSIEDVAADSIKQAYLTSMSIEDVAADSIKQAYVDPHRIIIDTHARTPLTAKVLNLPDSKAMTIIATTEFAPLENRLALEAKGATVLTLPSKDGHVDLKALIKKLGEMHIDSVLVEGGSELNFSLFNEQLVDRVFAFIAPKIIGGRNAKTPVAGKGIAMMRDAIQLENVKVSMIESDILIEATVKKEDLCLPD
jgi:diaminohydroxyphosphoribosylaminopyrimidine deaminase/5-amino-6-(5-phosphoribosylamino)uracil reductase